MVSFNSTWDTSKTSSGSSNSAQIRLPLESNGTYNFTVDWGDGNSDTITAYNQAEVIHDYGVGGIYNISISGIIEGFRFNNRGDKLKILDISQWGILKLGNNNSYFYGCLNLDINTIDELNLTNTATLYRMFRDAISFNGNIGNWNVSNVTNMGDMFRGSPNFNQNIGNWNVSNVTNMRDMFRSNRNFNQDISNWNVSSVTNMGGMFRGALNFNQDIGNWNVSSVISMLNMFQGALNFNQNINNWNVSNVMSMGGMFFNAKSFNGEVSNWDVSNVANMANMFQLAANFNRNIGSWNVSNVISMFAMFEFATSFNQNISNWNVSNVTNMRDMFYKEISFNQDIGSWDVSKVTDMFDMFLNVTLSPANYDSLLIGWSKLNLQNNVSFHGGNSIYSSSAAIARQSIIDNFNWSITDGGEGILPEGFATILEFKSDKIATHAGEQIRLSLTLRNDGEITDDLFIKIIDTDTDEVIYSRVYLSVIPFTQTPSTSLNTFMPNKTWNLRLEAGHTE